MRLLIIGGTQFVGRHIAEIALERGHQVTVFHRGKTNADAVPDAEHILGDRDSDLENLGDGHWDATIDVCAYVPRQVDELAEALGERGGKHVFISTVSVYAEPAPPDNDEDAPLAALSDPTTEVVDGETYGGLKVLCEGAVSEHYTDAIVIRPTYVVGPHDYTHRFTYWVMRIADGGRVVAPDIPGLRHPGDRRPRPGTLDPRAARARRVGHLPHRQPTAPVHLCRHGADHRGRSWAGRHRDRPR